MIFSVGCSFQPASSTSSHIQHMADALDCGSSSFFLLHVADFAESLFRVSGSVRLFFTKGFEKATLPYLGRIVPLLQGLKEVCSRIHEGFDVSIMSVTAGSAIRELHEYDLAAGGSGDLDGSLRNRTNKLTIVVMFVGQCFSRCFLQVVVEKGIQQLVCANQRTH